MTLPSLYVFNALVGSRLTLAAVVKLLLATLGVIVAVLASLGPIVAFFSVSTTSYPFILLFNVAIFASAGFLGMLFCSRLAPAERGPARDLGRRTRDDPGRGSLKSVRARSNGRAGAEPPRQDDLPALADRVWPGGSPDGVGASPVRRESQSPLHLVSRPGVQLLQGRVADVRESFLLRCERNGSGIMGLLVGVFRLADEVLRSGSEIAVRRTPCRRGRLRAFAILIVVFGMFYGGVMGTYGAWPEIGSGRSCTRPSRSRSCLSSPFLLGLPSFFVLNTLLGLRNDFARVVAALLATQAGLTVILASLAPFTAFWYVSGIGLSAGHPVQRPDVRRGQLDAAVAAPARVPSPDRPHPAHRWMLRTWLVIYIFVGIQMGWVLRPFIGDPGRPVQFFRQDSWSNAYVAVIEMIGQVMFRR